MTAGRRVEHCMGTVFSIDLRGDGVAEGALDEAIGLLHTIDATFSTYRADSVISRLGRGELNGAELGEDVRHVLDACAWWQTKTDGWFSARASGALDPSGYVKGWAIQRVSDLLRDAGSTSHCVNGGGDLQCVGTSGPGEPWRAGIADPRDRSMVIAVVAGADLAVATSGTAERGRHILDPRTARPPSDPLLSLSVSGRSIVECDVYATAGFAMGAAARDWFTGRCEVSTFAVAADGTTWSTSASQVASVTAHSDGRSSHDGLSRAGSSSSSGWLSRCG
jgi:thiamine biosynthesis lipoprotein